MRVLVSAASKHGATREIAEAIGEQLRNDGFDVHVLAPEEVAAVDEFDAAVVGSGVYLGRWLEPAKRLVEREAAGLRSRRVWLFSSGPVGEPAKPDGEPADGARLRELIGAREDRVFAGRIDTADLGIGEKVIVRAVRAPPGDFRDWAEILAWASAIGNDLRVALETR
jgi:menaquinone-dependent protoporphyrinogen oxidase